MFGRLKRPARELPEFLQVPWGVRDVLIFVGAWFGLQVALTIALLILSLWVPPLQVFMEKAQTSDVGASFTLNLAGVVIGLGIVGLFMRRYGVSWRALGWRKINWLKAVIYLVVIMVAFVALANLALVAAEMLVPGFDPDQAQTNEFTEATQTHRSLALVALVLLPPIFEETIFRGFIFPALAKRAGVIWGAVLSSLLFGLAHGQANLFIYTAILGMLLCFMYVRLRSIVPGVMLHMLNNYLAFLALSGK